MPKSLIGLALVALLGTVPVCAAGPGEVEITYVANEGFLLAGGGGKVLVDALFGKGIRGYEGIPAATRAKLEAASAPFDGVDLVLATHYHPDHFDPAAVLRHLEANPSARFVSTPQAVEEVRELAGDREAITARLQAVLPDGGEARRLEAGEIRVLVLSLHHGRERQPPVQNLGFVVALGGMRILHVGDTEADSADFAPYEPLLRDIDVALLPEWFLSEGRWAQVVREQIRPVRIVAMHLATADAPASWFGAHGSPAGRDEAIRREFPGVEMPAGPDWSRTFSRR